METATDHFTSSSGDTDMNLVIFTDYKTTLSIIMESDVHGNYCQVLARVRPSLSKLHGMNCHQDLATPRPRPGHAGIDYNEQADALAKSGLKESSISAKGQLSLPVCKKMVAKHIKRLWQQRWDRSTTGRVTYELMCDVGKSMVFPSDRCCAISYCRLLLDGSTLKVHQFWAGLAQSKLCECSHGIDDLMQ